MAKAAESVLMTAEVWVCGPARTYLTQLLAITRRSFEIGRILHLKSRNPKSQTGLLDPAVPQTQGTFNLQSRISGFEMQDSSNFEILRAPELC
jgi:hypothetical protein